MLNHNHIIENIFLKVKVMKITFNDTLCHLLGINLPRHVMSHSFKFNTIGDELQIDKEMNYFNCARYELAKSYKNEIPFPIHFLSLKTVFANQPALCSVKTQKAKVFFIRKNKEYLAENQFNLYSNFPKLIFISASFIQSSLFGSYQKKILNFFPAGENRLGVIHHRFKQPIVLKMTPSSIFHIKLFDENLSPLKAGLGVSTLLALKQTSKEEMFPVTLISSDKKNKDLFPENTSSCFKNKLSFPLLFLNRFEWHVSLRSLAFPKVKNIYPEQCKLTFEKDGEQVWVLALESAFVVDIHNLIYLINSKIRQIFADITKFKLPKLFLDTTGKLVLETNGVDCFMEGSMMKLLGFSYSHPTGLTKFVENTTYTAITQPSLFSFQPQELILISNIVEEAYYAQSRPTILRIVPIPNQQEVIGYNYIQFEEHDNIGIKLDRIDDIEIKIITRKGNIVEFVDECDVKLQLEFKRDNVTK